MKTIILRTLTLMLLCFITFNAVYQPSVEAEQSRPGGILSDETLDRFLELGRWSADAEDTIYGEELNSNFVQSLVINYQQDTSNSNAINALGLLVLAEAVAGWGMKLDANLTSDPNRKSWKGTSKVGAGKHLMSYAKGGIGIPHADSGFLKSIFDYLKTNHPNLADEKETFFRLKGINYDILCANGGHCRKPSAVVRHDLKEKRGTSVIYLHMKMYLLLDLIVT